MKSDAKLMKCEICGNKAISLIEKLCNGPRGFRRYKVCMTCAKKVEQKNTTQKAA